MADKSLTFNLFGHDISASKAVGEFADKAHGHITGLIGDLAKLGLGFFGISSVVEFGKGAVEAAQAAQDANVKLQTALTNTHSSININNTAIQDARDKLSDYGFTGAQTTDALAVLTTGVGNSTKALSLMQVTADLAKYKNIGLSDAALIVAKGFEGQIRPLKALGIDLPVVAGGSAKVEAAQKKLADAQQKVQDLLTQYPDAADKASKHHAAYEAAVKKVSDAQQSLNDKSSTGQQIIDGLTQRLQGQAAHAADTYAGRWAAVSAKWDEIQVKAGQVLLPALGGISDFLDKHLLPDLENLGKSKGPENMARDLAKALGWNGGDSAGPLSGNAWANGWDQLMGKFGNGWDQWVSKFGHGWEQITAKNESSNGALGNGWDQLMGKFGNGWSQWMGMWGNGWSQMMGIAGNGWSQLTGKFSNGWSQIEAAFSNGAAQIAGAFANGWSQIESGWNGVIGAFQNGWNQIQAFVSGHPVQGQIQWSNVVPPPPSGGGGGSLVARPFASGGFVNRPTFALVGEAGPEAVIPLNDQKAMKGFADLLAGHGGGGNITINIHEVNDPVGTGNAVLRRLNARGAV